MEEEINSFMDSIEENFYDILIVLLLIVVFVVAIAG